MFIVTLTTAKLHLKEDSSDQDALITLYIEAAEETAIQFLNRRVYIDQAALNTAIAGVQATLAAATVAYDVAITAAALLTVAIESDAATAHAVNVYSSAQTVARETRAGIVKNDVIKAAILLTLGDLFANREETIIGTIVASLPFGARALMQPYRAGMSL